MRTIIAVSVLLAIAIGWATPYQYLWVLWLASFMLAARLFPRRSDQDAIGMLIAEAIVAAIAIGMYLAFPDYFHVVGKSVVLILILLIPYTMWVKRVESNNRISRELIAMKRRQQLQSSSS